MSIFFQFYEQTNFFISSNTVQTSDVYNSKQIIKTYKLENIFVAMSSKTYIGNLNNLYNENKKVTK